MAVKSELKRLKQEKEKVQKRISEIQTELDEELLLQYALLGKKKEQLFRRTSPLAQTLQTKIQKELEEKQQEIDAKSQEIETWTGLLQATQEQIDARENDTTLYIQEQVHLMVPAFLKWVEENKESIGYDITRSFIVAGVIRRNENLEGRYNYPTGEVGIFAKGEKCHEETVAIVLSYDFYFTKPCYDADYSKHIVRNTIWYTQYLKDFIAAFLQKLEESYNLGEDLKLTIKSPEFTLELV